MTPENGFREPGNEPPDGDMDYDDWLIGEERGRDFADWKPIVIHPPTYPRQRWCPSHRRYEINPEGRLRCGAAWAEQYELERDVDAEMMHPNSALIKLAKNIGELVEEIRIGGVIAEPPTKPQRPVPPAPPAPPPLPRSNGKGGVALP